MGKAEELIKARLREVGAVAVGIATAREVAPEEWARFERWLERGDHAGMEYMRNHAAIRRDPQLLLPGAQSLICCAFSYRPIEYAGRPSPHERVATYALLPDYHDWVRERIRHARLDELLGEEGTDWRICVDSAPILERYWAQQAGIGIIGRNGALIVPGVGCEVILCEIITDTQLQSDERANGACLECGLCKDACPTGANADIGPDCNRCLSYLTIEHKGDWTDRQQLDALDTEAGKECLFGCDRCMAVCPMNNPQITSTLEANRAAATITLERILTMTPQEFATNFKTSPLKRARLSGLTRNASKHH